MNRVFKTKIGIFLLKEATRSKCESNQNIKIVLTRNKRNDSEKNKLFDRKNEGQIGSFNK